MEDGATYSLDSVLTDDGHIPVRCSTVLAPRACQLRRFKASLISLCPFSHEDADTRCASDARELADGQIDLLICIDNAEDSASDVV